MRMTTNFNVNTLRDRNSSKLKSFVDRNFSEQHFWSQSEWKPIIYELADKVSINVPFWENGQKDLFT